MAATSLAKQAETMLKRVRKWDTEFLCVGSQKDSFNVPPPEQLLARVTVNLEYFSVNYAICLALFALIAVVVYPQLLVLVCVFSGLWYGLATRPSYLKIQVGAALLTKKHLVQGLAAVNALVVLIFARTVILATVGASFLFVLIHAGMHSVPSNAKGAAQNEEP
mmetsp:Transcript_33358/g.72883  ORF Transcript_33358/g.72883 Transcript_33358/m.72883 type:complete len:164 (-) Transcript_33358:259-750(-)